MAETLTRFTQRSLGNQRSTWGRFTSSGTEVDIITGLKRVVWCAVQGIQTPDNNVSVARNSSTTTDNSMNAMGQVHCELIASGTTYMFVAEGF